MLLRENRLKNKKEINAAFKGGRAFAGNFLILKVKNSAADDLKVGFVVPQKVFRSAAQRNRIKRVLREAVRGKISQLKKGHHLLFLAKKEVQDKAFSDIASEVETLLRKAGLQKHVPQPIG